MCGVDGKGGPSHPGRAFQQHGCASFPDRAARPQADDQANAAGIRLAAGVAVSLRCQTQLIPVRFDPPGTRAKRSARVGCGTGGTLRGYNRELGTQYAHSPSTGRNYLLDPSTDWQENGPQGPGYYRGVGNGYEKLELGRDDDC